MLPVSYSKFGGDVGAYQTYLEVCAMAYCVSRDVSLGGGDRAQVFAEVAGGVVGTEEGGCCTEVTSVGPEGGECEDGNDDVKRGVGDVPGVCFMHKTVERNCKLCVFDQSKDVRRCGDGVWGSVGRFLESGLLGGPVSEVHSARGDGGHNGPASMAAGYEKVSLVGGKKVGRDSFDQSYDIGGSVSAERRVDGVGLVNAYGHVLGPNYERNKLNRERKKEGRGRAVSSGDWRVKDDPHAGLASEVRFMRLERQKIQEQRKLDKLRSPTQIIEDAMKMVKLAEGYARKANDNKVAAWAASLSQSSAESIAKSGGSLPSVESVVAGRALEAKQARLGFDALPMNAVESAAVREKVMTAKQVLDARFKCDRVIKMADFERKDFPYAMSSFQARRIATAAYS